MSLLLQNADLVGWNLLFYDFFNLLFESESFFGARLIRLPWEDPHQLKRVDIKDFCAWVNYRVVCIVSRNNSVISDWGELIKPYSTLARNFVWTTGLTQDLAPLFLVRKVLLIVDGDCAIKVKSVCGCCTLTFLEIVLRVCKVIPKAKVRGYIKVLNKLWVLALSRCLAESDPNN